MHSQAEAAWRTVQLLWGSVSPPAKGPRPKFTLEDVARAGVTLADETGLTGVTLSSVSSALGLTTTAIYRYVNAKETLIEVMVDFAAGPPPALAEGSDWRNGVREWTQALLDVFVDHPWLTDVKPSSFPRCPNGFAWYAALLKVLADADLDDPTEFVTRLNVLVRGYASLSHSIPRDPPAPPPWFRDVVVARYPEAVAALGRPRSLLDQFWVAFDQLIASSATGA
jgi:AcrR family transcriptional regulator